MRGKTLEQSGNSSRPIVAPRLELFAVPPHFARRRLIALCLVEEFLSCRGWGRRRRRDDRRLQVGVRVVFVDDL
jgi:hypothetical protein